MILWPNKYQKVLFLSFFVNCSSFLTVATDIMVATGHEHCVSCTSYVDYVENIRITEAGNDVKVEKCSQLVPTHPLKVNSASGATLSTGDPLICGGKSNRIAIDTCYKLNKNEWREAPQLPSARYAFAMTNTDSTIFISGGYTGGTYLNDVYLLNGGSWQPLSPMPKKMIRHCLVAINGTHLLNIGGYGARGGRGDVSK